MSPKMGYMPFVCVCVYVCVCVFEHVLICVHAFCSQMNVISILMQQQSCWWNILVEALMVVLLSFHILRLRVGIVKVLLVSECVCLCVCVCVCVCGCTCSLCRWESQTGAQYCSAPCRHTCFCATCLQSSTHTHTHTHIRDGPQGFHTHTDKRTTHTYGCPLSSPAAAV